MTLSLRARLFLAHALVVVVTLAVLVVITASQQRRWLIDRDRESLERTARLVARELGRDPARARGSWSAPAHTLRRALGARVTLIDGSGRVLGDSDVEEWRLPSVENHRGRPEVRAALGGRTGHAIRRSATVGVEFLYVAIPFRLGDVTVVRVAEPMTTIGQLNASLLGLSIVVVSLTLVVGLVLVYWLTGLHAARIRELERVAERLGAGERARAREQPADELGKLGRALNQMAAELRERLAALEGERDARERILAHMTDGVALLDHGGLVVHMNHSLAMLLGVPRPAPPGTAFHEFVRAPEVEELLKRARRAEHAVESELRLWTPHPRLVRAAATALGGSSDGALLLVLQDLTEAERVNRVRQDFVANVSHELRTPLTSLRGYAETLLSGGLDDVEHRRHFVEIIRDQTVRLQALVEDLLSLAELERPGIRLRLEELDLRDLAASQMAAARGRADAAGLGLELVPGSPVRVVADRTRLDQVIANLLDNALKYTEQGRVRLRVGSDAGAAWCEVEDTGPGIPEADQPRIFERFYRVDKARSREKGGTGLGLSIVKHIVALHGGRITLRSSLGRGSTFRFEVPLGLAART